MLPKLKLSRMLVLGSTLAFIFFLATSSYVGAYSPTTTKQKCNDCFSGYSLTSESAKITSASVSLKVPSVKCPSSSSAPSEASEFFVSLDGTQQGGDYESATLTILCISGLTTPFYSLSYFMGTSGFGTPAWTPSA